MADTNQTPNRSDSANREPGKSDSKDTSGNQTMQNERSNPGSGQDGGQRQPEQGRSDKDRQEKSAIGGGENRSQSGEPGRARNELDEKENKSEFGNQR